MSGFYYKPIKRIFLNLSGGTVTGDTVFTEGVYGARLSGGTIWSGDTNLETIIRGLVNTSEDITRVQPGTNTFTGGTPNFPTVNLSDDISLNSVSASIISGDTFFSAGTAFEVVVRNLIYSKIDLYTTAATLHNNVLYFDRIDQASAYTVDLSTLAPTGGTDSYTTASTLVGQTVFFDRTDQASAYTLDLSGFATTDYFVTGGTFDKDFSQLTLSRNDGVNVVITGLTDYYTTAVTLYNNILYFDRIGQLSAFTVDLSSLVDDTNFYTTAATLVGTTVYYDRTDQLSAYTLDLSGFATTDYFITGATYDKGAGELTLSRNDGIDVIATGITDYYATAATLVGNTVYFDRIDQLSAFTLDLTAIAPTGGTDYYVTGGTFIKSSDTLELYRNDGASVSITGLTDYYTTAVTLYNNILYFDRIDQLSAYTVDLSVLTPTGGTDNYTTAATLVGDVVYFDRTDQSSAYTLSLSGFSTTDIYVTGATYNPLTNELIISRNDGGTVLATGFTDYYTTASTLVGQTVYFDRVDQASAYTLSLTGFSTDDFYITGGTFNKPTSTLTLSRNDGFDVVVSGISDNYTTAATLYNNVLYFDTIDQLSAYTVDLSTLAPSGGTGTDYYTTASTLVGTTVYFDRIDQLSAYTLDLSSLLSSGNTYITGGSFSASANTLTLDRNDGEAIIIEGFIVSPYRVEEFTGATTTFQFSSTTNNALSIRNQSSGPIRIDLPSNPQKNDFYAVKDALGNSITKPITISGGTQTIDGNNNVVIRSNKKYSLYFLYDGVEYIII